MKTVIQIVQHLTPGGIEVMALELQKMKLHDTRMLIISLEGNRHDTIDAWPRLRSVAEDIIFLNKQPGIQWKLIARLAQIFRKTKACAIHTHHIGPLIYGGLAARLAGVDSLVHTEHDAWHLEDTRRSRLQRLILRVTRPALIADSDIVAEGMKSHLRTANIKVIRNGIDVKRFRPGERKEARSRLGLREDVPWIGSGGRLEEVKGHSTLIDAMASLPVDVHLALAGNGSMLQSLQKQVERLGLQNRVLFLGHLDNMPTFYQALDIFCLPSLHEGMPLAPLEAQACGIPAVITNTGGSGDAICKKTGRLVSPGNSQALAEALCAALKQEPQMSPRAFVEHSANLLHMGKAYAEQYHFQAGSL